MKKINLKLLAIAALTLLIGTIQAQNVRKVEIFSSAAGNASSNEVAVVSSTGLVYNFGQAFGSNIGVIDPATNTLIKSIRHPEPHNTSNSFYSRTNQATSIVYFLQQNSKIVAVDGRPSSPTFNQTLPLISFSNETIHSFAIDQTRHRLYVTTRTIGSNPVQSQIRIVDINPANQTFNQAVASVILPGGQQIGGVAVNSVTNKIYVTSQTANGGVFVLSGANQSLTLVAGTLGALGVAVNETTNMIYAGKLGANGVFSIDGATDTLSATVSVPNLMLSVLGDFIAVNTVAGRIYLVSGDNTLRVLDGNKTSPTFNTIIAGIPNVGNHRIAVDESTNKIIVTSNGFKTTIVDGTTNTIAATTFGNFGSQDVVVNPLTRRAYVAYVFYMTQVINLDDNSYANIETAVELGESVVNPNNNFFYFQRNRAANDIAFLDANDSFGLVGGLPHGFGRTIFAARNTVTNRVYMVNSAANAAGTDRSPGYVSVIDGATNNVIANVEVGGQPFSNPAVNEVTNKIYVMNAGLGGSFTSKIMVINGATNTASTVNTSALPPNSTFIREPAVNPVTNKIYFRVSEGVSMGVINGATDTAALLPGFSNVSDVKVNPSLNRIYLMTSTGLRVLDGDDDTEIANIAVTGSFAINKNTGRIFVRNFQNQTLTAIDGNSNAVIATVPLANVNTQITVNEAANRLYVGAMTDFNDERTSSVLFINGETLAVESSLPIPLTPGRISINPATKTVYVTTINAFQRTGIVVISDKTNLTAAGQNVSIAPASGVNMTFGNVTTPGETLAAVLTTSQLPTLPSNFSLIGSSLMYNITTTAVFSGSITVGFSVPNIPTATACSRLRILHYVNNDWDLSGNAVPVYNAASQRCALSQTVSSLSPFVVVQSNPPANIEQCKNDGWKRFDTPRGFNNQGDCVKFVNTGK